MSCERGASMEEERAAARVSAYNSRLEAEAKPPS